MRKTFWSPEAALDLQNIYRFYLQVNPTFAGAIYKQIRQDANLLKKFPNMAPAEPLLEGYSRNYRSLTVMNMFKIIYYIDNELIKITNVWDCRQNPEKLIKRISNK